MKKNKNKNKNTCVKNCGGHKSSNQIVNYIRKKLTVERSFIAKQNPLSL